MPNENVNVLQTLIQFRRGTDVQLFYIRDIFVFASFTALSFVDIKKLTNSNIVEVNGEKWIDVYKRQRHIILLRKDTGSRQGTVSTDNYQCIDVLFLYDLISFRCV